ncbi:uncharacterized protein LAESUDRAFT_757423 [Laetiporus sulphureus 93-53]|uniref:BRCA2 OB1 domain-containing protein n=1 Tax=Laetiporus sulphureus 93-53 TaxID=1314785 RepID=A0A165FBB7_9APHY|nr:uncharacterized protein LAESUDRAFT_757423 [Laetiporus sulphureus 93-53]KZT08707.1 hypothetical protein LAESUDRAFT_757423 [Laetiporus sulphureus 93-53]
MSRLASESPSPKRQRLSSPTYDEQCFISQAQIAVFDEVDKRLSQGTSSVPRPSQRLSLNQHRKRSSDIAFALDLSKKGPRDDKENIGDDDFDSPSSSPLDGVAKKNHGRQISLGPLTDMHSVTPLRTSELAKLPAAFGRDCIEALGRNSDASDPLDDNTTADTSAEPASNVVKSEDFETTSIPQVADDTAMKEADDLPSSSPDIPVQHDSISAPQPLSIPAEKFLFKSAKFVTDDDIHPGLIVVTEGPIDILSRSPPRPSTSSNTQLSPAHMNERASDRPVSYTLDFTSAHYADLLKNSQTIKAKGVILPSAETFAAFEEQKQFWDKLEKNCFDASDENDDVSLHVNPPVPETPTRSALRAVENSSTSANPPDTPTPLGREGPLQGLRKVRLPASGKNGVFKSPFKSPDTVGKPGLPSSYVSSPLNPKHSSMTEIPAMETQIPAAISTSCKPKSLMQPPAAASTPCKPEPSSPRPSVLSTPCEPELSTQPPATVSMSCKPEPSSQRPAVLSTPCKPEPSTPLLSSTFPSRTPVKTLGLTPRRVGGGAGASRPFKTPSRLGSALLERQQTERGARSDSAAKLLVQVASNDHHSAGNKNKAGNRFFDLAPPVGRHTLASCGLVPQFYNADTLQSMGIDAVQLNQMTPESAMYYFFDATPLQVQASPEAGVTHLGPDAALKELRARGCKLAKKAWVDNHWGMILWKLAGMVCLQPEHESNPETRRWCWDEVMRQLLYRYEREINGGSRPAFRLITTHDASPSCPMVLCVSKILWSEAGADEEGITTECVPQLELTDGWYRLRANVDDPLERAIRKGHIRVGRKLAIANARLVSKRKGPDEVLDAYNSMSLHICGNSSHLAPWHAKLGFMRSPPTTTLDSLSPDGGLITLVDVTVVKAYPIGYIEYIERDGETFKEGPHSERDEAKANEEWKKRSEREADRLRHECEQRFLRYEGFADKCQTRAGSRWAPPEDACVPSDVECDWETIVGSPESFAGILRNLSTDNAGWMAMHAREYVQKEREAMYEDIQKELQSLCPPRNARSFRAIVVQDARWSKRRPYRKAQLTIWDVVSLNLTEGSKAGHFKQGHRLMITNLKPTQLSAWMVPDVDSEIYLTTRKDSRISLVKN